MKKCYNIITIVILILVIFLSTSCSDSKSMNGITETDIESELVNEPADSQMIDSLNQEETKAINEIGSKVINIMDAHNFSDGVAWVYAEDDEGFRWFCIDKEGTIIFKLDYDSEPTTDFAKGIAIVDEKKIINKTGNTISSVSDGLYDSIVTNYNINDPFNGLIWVKKHIESFDISEDRFALIDHSGNIIYDFTNKILRIDAYVGNDVYKFREISEKNTAVGNSTYYFNARTKEIFRVDHILDGTLLNREKLSDTFNDGYALLRDPHSWPIDSTIHSVDTSGNRKLIMSGHDVKAYRVGAYSGGVFFCEDSFYDIEGKLVVDLSKYKARIYYKEGKYFPKYVGDYCLLLLKNPEGTGYYTVIDKSGEFLLEPEKYNNIGELSCELFSVYSDGKWTIKNVMGEIITELYEDSNSLKDAPVFRENIALIKSKNGYYYIDINGNRLF